MKKQVINNHRQPTHGSVVNRLLRHADEAIICAAFLKNSGLRKIAGNLPENCTCYIGKDYFLTEPAALRQLLDWGVKLYLTREAGATFHPKIYYARNGRKINVVTGSANLTGGGLESNLECSILLTAAVGSTLDREFRLIFGHYEIRSEWIFHKGQLEQYEEDFKRYRQKHREAVRAFRRERRELRELPLPALPQIEREYQIYLNGGGAQRFRERQVQYAELRNSLDRLLAARITSPRQFLDQYEPIAANFYSSDLLRGKTIFARGYRRIIAAIRFIREHRTGGPLEVYGGARRIVLPATRFGVNGITEIMNVYNSNFSVANGRASASLSALYHLHFAKPRKSQFDERRYLAHHNLIEEIRQHCNATDLGQVDHFLSWYFDTYLRDQ